MAPVEEALDAVVREERNLVAAGHVEARRGNDAVPLGLGQAVFDGCEDLLAVAVLVLAYECLESVDRVLVEQRVALGLRAVGVFETLVGSAAVALETLGTRKVVGADGAAWALDAVRHFVERTGKVGLTRTGIPSLPDARRQAASRDFVGC